jgi:hypothetical protein
MQKRDSLYEEEIFAEGNVLVMRKYELWYLYRCEGGHMLPGVFCHLSLQGGCVRSVYNEGSFRIVGGNGAVVYEMVC